MTGLDDEEKVSLILSVGKGGAGGRRRLGPVQVSRLLRRCVDNGDSVKQLAEQLQVSGDMVARFLSLQKLSPTILALIDWGSSANTLSFSAAHMLTALPNDEAREELARRSVELGLTKAKVEQIVQRFNRSGHGLDEALSRIIALQPVIERRHLIIGAITEPALSEKLEEQGQEQRDVALQEVLTKLIGANLSSRLVADRFTISTSEEIANRVLSLKPDFETAINNELSIAIATR